MRFNEIVTWIFTAFWSLQFTSGQFEDPNAIDSGHHHRSGFPCYNEYRQAQRCVPEFVNAAFSRKVDVTNTCGEHQPKEYCVQSGHSGMHKQCDVCDKHIPGGDRSPSFLTDFNNPDNETWWQSETMKEDIQFPNMVNLTLQLGKAFDITYVRLKFHSPRPESFAIYKKSRSTDAWVPWQYYSATCRTTYQVPERAPILPGAETVAQCTSDYSDISPLTGGNVAFSTLEGRPSAQNFEGSTVLQDWVTATEIRIVLNRLNTFGDEVFRDDKVLRSYYYAISDFAVGGRCKCNGHASECVKSTGGGEQRLVCRCEHYTMGEDCDQCQPFYNDRPWQPATAEDANECKTCDCNGLSNRCYFEEKLFQETGSGGHCVDCSGNTRGPHCEKCLENHWRRPGDRACHPCNCVEIGSLYQQCNEEGQCPCKPGVTGQFCDRCSPGFYKFSMQGCQNCGCLEAGSFNNQPNCRPDNGDCACKTNVEGKTCDRCKPGYFHMDLKNEFGCTPCFCHGHSSVCESADGYYKSNITSDFSRGFENWKAEGANRQKVDVQYNERDKNIAATELNGVTYFLAPEKFLGNQRSSYNQYLTFKLRVVDRNSRASGKDIILQGANGQSVSVRVFAQNNQPPDIYEQTYRYRLHEDPKFEWTPRLTSLEFLSLLSNLTVLKIRATYSSGDAGFLDDVSMGSTDKVPSITNGNGHALWVESCTCPEGFVGQNCESCAPGYRREPKYGGSYARCIKCECHGHAVLCGAESGHCICQDNTAGDSCERCKRGYFGNALKGTVDDCQPCPCPSQGPCILHTDNDTICLECAMGYAGRRCDICADGYYGDPQNEQNCTLCECSGNIDPNSIGNCDRKSGECKKCIHNTRGFHCETCAAGYYGDALLEPKGDCKKCNCYAAGTVKPSINYKFLECEQNDGKCDCMPYVTGRACNECEPGYFNITSGSGCQSCNCDPMGSVNTTTCDIGNGQCLCKEGVTGRRCEKCQPLHFGFSSKGCQPCDCLPIGSTSPQCDSITGQCQCLVTVEGRRCDQCMENKYNLQAGCLECDACYGLIQKRVNGHRDKLGRLKTLLKDILENPTTVNDTNFENKLKEVLQAVNDFKDEVQRGLAGDDTGTLGKVNELRKDLDDTENLINQIGTVLTDASASNDRTSTILERWTATKNEVGQKLSDAENYLNTEGKDAWEQATKASDLYGKQSTELTNIAEEARKLAAKHKNDSAKIEEYANKALNASQQAEKGADEAVFGGHSISREISRLQNQFEEASGLYNQTEQTAQEQKESVDKLHDDAAAILNKVQTLQLPKIPIDEISKEAAGILESAKDARKGADDLDNQNRDVVDQANRFITDADYEFRRAEDQQQIADSLLADLNAARAKAKAALETAENTLKEANKTLEKLKEFDAFVEKSKVEAIAAMENVPSIEKTIADAENRTNLAGNALGNARGDAANAEGLAQQAQTVAEGASKVAMQIKNEADETKLSAQNLKGEAEKVKKETATKLNLLNDYKKNVVGDKVKAHQALSEASSAELAGKKAYDTADAAMETLNKILEELNSLDGVDDKQLDDLEKSMKSAEENLAKVDLENSVDSLKRKQQEQQKKINVYANEIERLTKEVNNIEQIRLSLPDQCFNVVELEGNRR